MKKIKKYVTIAVAGIMMLSFAGCNMIERTPETIQKTVYAKVGKTKITKADVDKYLKSQLEQCKQQYGDDFESNPQVKESLKQARKQTLDSLVMQEVLLQSKESVGVNPTDEEIQEKVDETLNSYKERSGSDEEFEAFVKQCGFDDEESLVDFLKKQEVIQMVYEKVAEKPEITDEDVESKYNENKDTYKEKAGAEVTHVLVMPERGEDGKISDEADAKAKSLAEAVKAQADSGKSLKEISESDEFKEKAMYQELGRIAFDKENRSKESGNLDEAFDNAFKVLPVNKVSEVVKSDSGYHVIVNTAIYADDEVTPLNDRLKEEIKQKIYQDKQQEVQEKFQAKVEDLKKNLKVKIYEDKL